MTTILALLQCVQPEVSNTDVKRLCRIIEAMLRMNGRVTMLGLSRWAGKGGSYRTIQRFFNTAIPWERLFHLFFQKHLYQAGKEYFLVGDESVVTKSGKQTFGLDTFFSGLLGRVTKSVAIFTLAVVDVEARKSIPIGVQQVVRTQVEKEETQEKRKAKKATARGRKVGRPKGSKNRDKTKVTLTAELQRIQKMVQKQLACLPAKMQIKHFALDGHFGNNNAVQMVRQCGLHLISKLRYDAALYFLYVGLQKKHGPLRRYGDKINYQAIPEKYQVECHREEHVETRIYQAQMLHKDFAQPLNVVVITKRNLKTGRFATVNLFASDLTLTYDKIIDYYSLRFQIEFNFRDAKQFWGLEDFMNVKQQPLTNALNLSLFMVNFSHVLLQQFRQTNPESGILDLKAYFRAEKYVHETIKLLPEKPDPILLEHIIAQVASLDCIHSVKVLGSSP